MKSHVSSACAWFSFIFNTIGTHCSHSFTPVSCAERTSAQRCTTQPPRALCGVSRFDFVAVEFRSRCVRRVVTPRKQEKCEHFRAARRKFSYVELVSRRPLLAAQKTRNEIDVVRSNHHRSQRGRRLVGRRRERSQQRSQHSVTGLVALILTASDRSKCHFCSNGFHTLFNSRFLSGGRSVYKLISGRAARAFCNVTAPKTCSRQYGTERTEVGEIG